MHARPHAKYLSESPWSLKIIIYLLPHQYSPNLASEFSKIAKSIGVGTRYANKRYLSY